MLKSKWQFAYREGIDPSQLAAVLASHQHHRHHLAKKRGRPFTGAYYWVPDDNQNWSILVHPNAFYEGGEAGHVDVWEDLVYIVARMNRIDPTLLLDQIGNCPYGLPRGRVVRMGNGDWAVAHGNDHPANHDLESVVTEGFCLGTVCPKFFIDDHEQMLPGDFELVRESLHHRLNAPVPQEELLE